MLYQIILQLQKISKLTYMKLSTSRFNLEVIDKKGAIRFKWIGAISEETWRTVLKPMVEQLQREPE